jgi:hypothetical protein
MAHGSKKTGTHPSHGAQLYRREMYLSAGPGRGAKKQIMRIDRAETPHLVRGDPAPGLPYTDAVTVNRRSQGLQALRLAPRRGHEPIELAVRGAGMPLVKRPLPSQQSKRSPEFRVARRERLAKVQAERAEKLKAAQDLDAAEGQGRR